MVLTGTLGLALIGALSSLLLSRTSKHFVNHTDEVVDAIDRLLPQTQCAQCGYPGCKPYAAAIADGEAINKCPPGGDDTISALADLLGRKVTGLDPSCRKASVATDEQVIAVIREEECIGCTLCIKACPVDAIVGAAQLMHTVIQSECTGCELCLPPCPVDCIDLHPLAMQPPHTVSPPASGFECIRCGLCEEVCPRDLLPQDLYWYRDSPSKLESLELDQCIECRRCDRACPSYIPLTDFFRSAKLEKQQQIGQANRAQHTLARYEHHLERQVASSQLVRQRPSTDEKASLLDAIKQKRR